MEFEWDELKNALNLRKHGLDFDAAVRVFGDPLALDEEDGGIRDE